MPLPRLRPVDAYPVRLEGQDLICLRDLEGFVDEPVFLSPRAFLIASMLDGASEMVDLQTAHARRTGGDLLFSWDVQKVIDELDRHGLLQTERFAERRRAIEDAYRASAVRPAFHAGRSYPADPQALAADLDRYMHGVDIEELHGLLPRGAIAPHIDFARGGWCYAWAHAALQAASPDTVVILGVAHAGPDAPIIMTTKPFQTPLGIVPVDREMTAVLRRRVENIGAHETAHRTEHSIEFQVAFLQHVMGDRLPAIVPILCASFEQKAAGRSPRVIGEVEQFIATAREFMEAGRRVVVLASVDFSHVGPRFGDPGPADQALASRTSLGDREVLAEVAAGHAEAFWAKVTDDGNRQRIDAAGPVYVALRILEPCQGRLLRYGQAPDPAEGIVSFASVAFL